jgi:hypothetical protein
MAALGSPSARPRPWSGYAAPRAGATPSLSAPRATAWWRAGRVPVMRQGHFRDGRWSGPHVRGLNGEKRMEFGRNGIEGKEIQVDGTHVRAIFLVAHRLQATFVMAYR